MVTSCANAQRSSRKVIIAGGLDVAPRTRRHYIAIHRLTDDKIGTRTRPYARSLFRSLMRQDNPTEVHACATPSPPSASTNHSALAWRRT